jgi:hypothetical protein
MQLLIVYAICAEMGIDPYNPMLSAQYEEFARRASVLWMWAGVL